MTNVLRISSDHEWPQRLNEQGQWIDTIPEPFWVRHFLFWWRPACYDCHIKFHSRNEWEDHFVSNHKSEVPKTTVVMP